MKPTVQDLLARKRAKTAVAGDKDTGKAGAGDAAAATDTGTGTGAAPIKGTAPPPSAASSSSPATADAAAARQMSPVKVGLRVWFHKPNRAVAVRCSAESLHPPI